MNNLINLFNAAILAGIPLLLGAAGGILIQKAGQSMLGTEGMMYAGGIAGVTGAHYYEQAMLRQNAAPSGTVAALVALVSAFAAGVLLALIFSILTSTLRANQTVVGISITILGTGLGNFIGEFLAAKSPTGYLTAGEYSNSGFLSLVAAAPQNELSFISIIKRLFAQYNWVVYFAIALTLILGWTLNNTRLGLRLRAVGENPSAADASGIRVTKYKYLATMIGGGIIGAGGMYISMVTCSGIWVYNCIGGRGYLAVAIVIFSAWSAYRALFTAFFFGALMIMRLYLPIPGLSMQIYDMLPYLATIVVLVITGIRKPLQRMAPKASDVNYFREDR